MIRSRRMSEAERVARMGGGRGEVNTVFWRGDMRERDCVTNLGVDGRIILKGILKKLVERAWTDLARKRDN
jgi:hypothetical protein